MGQVIYYYITHISLTEQQHAVCLAARGDYGGGDSARVDWLGMHAASGGRGGRSSASTMRVVVM